MAGFLLNPYFFQQVVATDPYYEYVSLLLTGDGTNGAQNNTFLDSSTNNFTITRNGNTTQGTFSPYGSLWSNYFDGATATRLTLPSNAAFAFGTGAYTVEAWVYLTSYASSQGSVFDSGNANGSFDLFITSSGALGIGIYGTGNLVTSSAGSVPLNQWVYVTAVRTSTSSNGFALYVNGISVATGTDSTNWTVTTTPSIGGINLSGYSTSGYISNLRVVKGTALYTSNFTPSTTPLTAVSGTSLLTCQSNRFKDNSSNNFTLTVNGNPSVQRFSPFNPTAPYSAATIGGSGYFDGTGDYLLTAASSNLEFGSEDFTIEFWWYPTATGRQALYCGSFGTDYSIGIDYSSVFPYSSQTIGIWASSNGSSWNLLKADPGGNGIGTITVKQNAWNHIAYVRSGTSWMLFVNGVRDLNITGLSGTLVNRSSAQKAIGSWFSAGSMARPSGNISDFRITKGGALYTGSTYTVPTSPLTTTVNSGTAQLLLSMTNAGISDAAMMNDLETVGNAQVSTSVKKYGTGSLAFVRSPSSYLVANNSSGVLSLGSGNFTLEAWIYMNTLPSANGYDASYWIVGGGRVDSNTGFDIAIGSTNLQVGLTSFASLNINTAHGMSSGVWYHIAIVRSGSTLYAFKDGVQLATASVSGVTVDPCLTGLAISAAEPTGATSGNFNGYIDDLRITKGYARYTSNFTPPTAAFPTY